MPKHFYFKDPSCICNSTSSTKFCFQYRTTFNKHPVCYLTSAIHNKVNSKVKANFKQLMYCCRNFNQYTACTVLIKLMKQLTPSAYCKLSFWNLLYFSLECCQARLQTDVSLDGQACCLVLLVLASTHWYLPDVSAVHLLAYREMATK